MYQFVHTVFRNFTPSAEAYTEAVMHILLEDGKGNPFQRDLTICLQSYPLNWGLKDGEAENLIVDES